MSERAGRVHRGSGTEAGKRGPTPPLVRANTEKIETVSATTESTSRMQDFGRIQLHAKPHAEIRPRLTISDPGDMYEYEADRVAGQVMSSSGLQLQRSYHGRGLPKYQARELDQETEHLHRISVPSSDITGTTVPPIGHEISSTPGTPEAVAPPIVHKVLSSPGQFLDATTRYFMESRFGHDFGRVRIHTDSEAAESAQAVNARAYTKGLHVVFGSGEYAPGTTQGCRIIAHELAHVLQRERGLDVVQRYPKGPGVLTSDMERRVDDALARMQRSSLNYEVAVANEILSGSIDVAFPDFEDTSASPVVPLAATSALTRKQQWEAGIMPKPDIKAFKLGTKAEILFDKGAEGFTAQHGDYDGIIYLLSFLPSGKLDDVLLHEALHLYHPLTIAPGQSGAEKEKFVSELRSYYYATYRNVNNLELRFERAVGDAEKDTGYLAGLGVSIGQVLLDREKWIAEAMLSPPLGATPVDTPAAAPPQESQAPSVQPLGAAPVDAPAAAPPQESQAPAVQPQIVSPAQVEQIAADIERVVSAHNLPGVNATDIAEIIAVLREYGNSGRVVWGQLKDGAYGEYDHVADVLILSSQRFNISNPGHIASIVIFHEASHAMRWRTGGALSDAVYAYEIGLQPDAESIIRADINWELRLYREEARAHDDERGVHFSYAVEIGVSTPKEAAESIAAFDPSAGSSAVKSRERLRKLLQDYDAETGREVEYVRFLEDARNYARTGTNMPDISHYLR